MPKVMMLGDVGAPSIVTPSTASSVPRWAWWAGGIVAAAGVSYVAWRLWRRRR